MSNLFFEDFERLFQGLNKRVNERLPFYDFYKEEDGTYNLEIALAGFSKKDIEVEQQSNVLVISANPKCSMSKAYLHKGISRRPIKLKFPMEVNWELKSVSFLNGILKFQLVTPETALPKKIEISTPTDDLEEGVVVNE